MSNLSILIIDSDRGVSNDIAKMLVKQGGSAVMSTSIANAVGAFWGHKYDAIFLEILLPQISGIDGMDQLFRAFPNTPIIAATSGDRNVDGYDLLLKARQTGASFLQMKPLQLDALLDNFKDAAAMKAGASREHVMVVDDSAVCLKITRNMLQNAGYRVSSFLCMEDAFEAMVLLNIDAVLTDIFMPGIGGIEGVLMIRNWKSDVAVIAMSGGLGNEMDGASALKAASKMGADQELPKPFTPDQLISCISAAIQSSRSKRSNAA
jgi:DNA-binding NtrC family response regulator